jgi:ATP-dependent DNA helicase RecG
MPQHHYQELMIRRSQLNHSWERIVEANYSIDDLDTQLINKIIKIAINKGRLEENADNFSIDHLLDKLKLIENGKLTRAAIVLFCKDERKQFIQSQVRLARFRGIDKNEFIDSKLYNGNIFYLYEKAMNFLNNYLPISGKIVEGEAARRDVPAIPLIVLREALINALIHRDYNIAGGAVSVAIYDDRVEVVNVGSLLAGLSVEKLTKPHSSVLRNPTIANVLYISGYIEMWGRGTTNIVNFSKEAGNPEPEFTATDIDFTVCLPLKESIGHETKTNYYQELNPRQQEILTLLSNGKVIKSAEILKMLSTHPSIRTIKADLLKLQQDGLIEKIGGGRSTAWKLKKA